MVGAYDPGDKASFPVALEYDGFVIICHIWTPSC